MTKQMNRIGFNVLTCLIAVGLESSLLADGYRNPPMTAEAIGKSGNAIVFADDASAATYNPANLAFQQNGSFVGSLTFAHLEPTYTAGITGDKAVADDPWQPLPNLFYSKPLDVANLVFGLGITTPYGQGSEYDRDALHDPNFRPNPVYKARLALVDINPNMALKLNDYLAIGGGASLIYSQLDFTQYFPWSLYVPVLPDGTAEVDADGYAAGGNAALTCFLTSKQRVALTYRSEFELDYEGDLELSGFAPIVPGTTPKSDFSTEINFPNIVGAGYGIELSESVRIEANVEWLEWSSNESINLDLANNQALLGGQNAIPNNWDDTVNVGVGGDWQFSEAWLLRAGYIRLESPIPDETITPLLADADRDAFSVGVGYQTGRHSVDLGYTYSIFDDREPSISENRAYPGTYDIDADLLSVTYSCTL